MKTNRFTLIELLVAIAIIAILAAILLPALGRAKYSANVIVCANKLKQIAMAWSMYEGDYDGYWPDYGKDPVYTSGTAVFGNARPQVHMWARQQGSSSAPGTYGDLRPGVIPYFGEGETLNRIVTCPLEIPAWQDGGTLAYSRPGQQDASGNWTFSHKKYSTGPSSTYAIYGFANTASVVHALDKAMRKSGEVWSPQNYDPDDLEFDILASDHFGWENPYGDRSWFGPKSSHYSRSGGSIVSENFADWFWATWNTPVGVPLTANFALSDGSVQVYWSINTADVYDYRDASGKLRKFHHSKGLMIPIDLAK